MKTLASIALFCYRRLGTLTQIIKALQKNYLAGESPLFIYSDGARKKSECVFQQIHGILEVKYFSSKHIVSISVPILLLNNHTLMIPIKHEEF